MTNANANPPLRGLAALHIRTRHFRTVLSYGVYYATINLEVADALMKIV